MEFPTISQFQWRSEARNDYNQGLSDAKEALLSVVELINDLQSELRFGSSGHKERFPNRTSFDEALGDVLPEAQHRLNSAKKALSRIGRTSRRTREGNTKES